LSSGNKDLEIVLDLDKAMIFASQEKPSANDKDYFKVTSKSKASQLYVYKRPHLE